MITPSVIKELNVYLQFPNGNGGFALLFSITLELQTTKEVS